MKYPDLMTKAEVMDYLRISRATLQRLMKDFAFPFIKFGKRVLFRRSEIDAYLESKTVKKAR
jgi:excisionase family DNA binding protein